MDSYHVASEEDTWKMEHINCLKRNHCETCAQIRTNDWYAEIEYKEAIITKTKKQRDANWRQMQVEKSRREILECKEEIELLEQWRELCQAFIENCTDNL